MPLYESADPLTQTKAANAEGAGNARKVAAPQQLSATEMRKEETRKQELATIGPDLVTMEKLMRWEMTHQLDEDGVGELVIKQSTFPGGGLCGCLCMHVHAVEIVCQMLVGGRQTDMLSVGHLGSENLFCECGCN